MSNKKLRILVTGGGGFIGRNLTQKLIDLGHKVTITSTGSEPIAGTHKVLYMSLEGIDWNFVEGQDVVFHQMANNDTRCMDRNEMWRANVYGPIQLFDVAYRGGCRNFVYASSTAVYGNAPAPYTEETPIKPLIPYAESKADFDKFAMKFALENGVSVTGLRYCNVYGPGESSKGKRMSMIGQILRSLIENKSPKLFTDGSQLRDWCYVKDVVDANLLAMQAEPETGVIYNIGSGVASSFNEIIQIGNDVLGKNIKPTYIDCPFPDEYQNHTQCEIEKATRGMAFSPKYNLRSGIEEYVAALINAA